MRNDKSFEPVLKFLEQQPKKPFLQYTAATDYLHNSDLDLALGYEEDLTAHHPSYVANFMNPWTTNWEQLRLINEGCKRLQTARLIMPALNCKKHMTLS